MEPCAHAMDCSSATGRTSTGVTWTQQTVDSGHAATAGSANPAPQYADPMQAAGYGNM